MISKDSETIRGIQEQLGRKPTYELFKKASQLVLDFESPSLLPVMREAVSSHPQFIYQLIRELKPIKSSTIGGLNVLIGHMENVVTLSDIGMLYTLTEFYPVHRNWSIITLNILNLMDNHQLQFKVYACDILSKLSDVFDISQVGLLSVFLDNLKIYLTFYNNDDLIVPILIDKSFKLVLKLDDSFENMVDLLNTVLVSIDKKFNRNDTSKHLDLLLDKLQVLVDILGPRTLVCLNRINFLLNQIITNPLTIEASKNSILKCLETQRIILAKFDDSNQEGKALVYDYRFDFIACWTILQRRSDIDISQNMLKLEKLAHDLNTTLEHV